MKKINKNKKGFTIVELVIVIAVIAILAAVLIPTFTNIIKSARESSDCQLVKNLNTAVAVEIVSTGKTKPSTASEALGYAKIEGYDVATIVAKSDNKIAWSVETGNFVVIDIENGTAIYPTTNGNEELKVSGNEVNYFIIVSEMPTEGNALKYSIYAGNNFTAKDNSVTLNGVGFDAGETSNITNITYNGITTAQNVVIRSNSLETVLTISDNNENSEQYHYGDCGIVYVTTGTSSYHENGDIEFLKIEKGHVVVEEGAVVDVVYSTSATDITLDVEGSVDHAHASSETYANTLNGNDDNGNKITNGVTWDYDSNTPQNNNTDVYHHVSDTASVQGTKVGSVTNTEDTLKDSVANKASTNEFISKQTSGNLNKYVARIGSTGYETLAAAFTYSNANAGSVITLLADIDTTSYIDVIADVTLNFDGKTITQKTNNERTFYVNNCTFTINGNNGNFNIDENYSSVSLNLIALRTHDKQMSNNTKLIINDLNMKGDTDTSTSLICYNYSYQEIILNNCNVTRLGATGNYGIVSSNNKHYVKLTINGGTYNYASTNTGPSCFALESKCNTITIKNATINTTVNLFENDGGTVNIENCIISYPNADQNRDWTNAIICVGYDTSSTTTVNGGSYSGKYVAYVYPTGGTININGGKFIGSTAVLECGNTSSTKSIINATNGTYNGKVEAYGNENAIINISGGTFTNCSFETKNGAHIVITGGIFDCDPTDYVDTTNYNVSHNTTAGTWIVKAK